VTLLAVKKDEGSVPMGGFHYMLHPIEMRSPEEAQIFQFMGYVIVEVDAAWGKKLVAEAHAALAHQVQVAVLVDGPESKRWAP